MTSHRLNIFKFVQVEQIGWRHIHDEVLGIIPTMFRQVKLCKVRGKCQPTAKRERYGMTNGHSQSISDNKSAQATGQTGNMTIQERVAERHVESDVEIIQGRQVGQTLQLRNIDVAARQLVQTWR